MTITELKEKILDGYQITKNDDLTIFTSCNLEELCQGANEIREKFSGNHIDLCSIINGKSGHCSENCKFCAQSVFNSTGCEVYDFLDNIGKKFNDLFFKRCPPWVKGVCRW